MTGAKITAIGSYVPARRLTNQDLEQMVDTNDEWIVQRTGIRERRISREDEYTSDLCAAAVRDMMKRYGKSVQDVDMVLVATSTPDFSFPSVASIVQNTLGIPLTAGAIDLSAACAGFVYALHTAHALVSSGLHHKVLVIGADTLSRITDYTDRSTCILFGDGAGAVLVESGGAKDDFMGYHLGSDGSGAQHVYRTGLAEKVNGVELSATGLLVQNGREVFKWAVRTVPQGVQQVLKNAGAGLAEVDWFIPHSANLRMIEPICERLNYPLEQALYSLEAFGNTSAASIPLALDLGIREGKVRSGQQVLLYGFGAGLSHAGQLVRLSLDPQVAEPTSL
ncbi:MULTISPECIES: ketoacyl-ACP synthase III [unclassified Paenibacillus]|uniref:ketoacyl-ACP synthase III n=1 Tax=unclassified Paenibacillus TaxID=185978 RepID=UPI0003E1F65A|nr:MULTISPECIES: ketoacyl-ACP synthase III [unclassified Paenibacillus]ETT32261.1 3-oxoacyl-(acyl carrier protein) synthase III [Paenibacillus sp. FSL R7-269]OMF88514.1 ketoacyl-ACP synthase III [Paenibacillus sp. FSL R7-0337]